MRAILYACLVLGVAAGCKKSGKPHHDPVAPAENAACGGGEARGPLTWHEDAYTAAMACAKATHRPVVIDMWAHWCHTCLSMQATVLREPSLQPFADRFVWLALDTDKTENASVVGQFALQVWPTFLVVSPDDGSIEARWLGAGSIAQFRDMLKDGESAYLASRSGTQLDPLMAGMRDGAQAANRKDWKAARAAWEKVLAAAPKDWPRRPDLLVSLMAAVYKDQAYGDCVQLAIDHGADTGNTSNAADFLSWGLGCADDKSVAPEKAKQVRETAVSVLKQVLADPAAQLSDDDRADAMTYLRDTTEALGDKDGAKAIAEQELAILDAAAQKAPDAWTRMTYNWPRAEVYVWLQRGEQLVPALEQSAKDLPQEYDPPYRLAWVLMKSGKPADALPWAQSAAKLVYGQRKARVQGLVVEIAKAIGDKKLEREAREELVRVLEALPAEVALPDQLEKAKKELAEMDATAGAGTGSGSEAAAGSGSGSEAAAGSGSEAAAGSGSEAARIVTNPARPLGARGKGRPK